MCIVFFVTLSCFPAIASSIVSVDKGSNDWTGRYNIPSVSLSFYTLIVLQIGLDIRDNFHIFPGWSVVVGRLIELVDHYSFRAIRFDHRYFFLYSINRYKLLYMLVNCFKIDLHISHHTF